MKYAILGAVLFLGTYVLANGGVGDKPLKLVPPAVVAVVVGVGVQWAIRRRAGGRVHSVSAEKFLRDSLAAKTPPPAPDHTPRPPGGARKLF